jgi:hypothetical protein
MPGFVSLGEVWEITFGDPCILEAWQSVSFLFDLSYPARHT